MSFAVCADRKKVQPVKKMHYWHVFTYTRFFQTSKSIVNQKYLKISIQKRMHKEGIFQKLHENIVKNDQDMFQSIKSGIFPIVVLFCIQQTRLKEAECIVRRWKVTLLRNNSVKRGMTASIARAATTVPLALILQCPHSKISAAASAPPLVPPTLASALQHLEMSFNRQVSAGSATAGPTLILETWVCTDYTVA